MHHPRILASIHTWHIPQQVKCAQTTVTGVNTHSITAVQRKSAIFGLYLASESFCLLPQCYLAFPALSISTVSVSLFSLHRTCNSAAFFHLSRRRLCFRAVCASATLSATQNPLRSPSHGSLRVRGTKTPQVALHVDAVENHPIKQVHLTTISALDRPLSRACSPGERLH